MSTIRTSRSWWGVTIEAPNPATLARFYAALLGWSIGHEEPGTVILAPPQEAIYVVFQQADDYTPPTWPPAAGDQRPMMHLDIEVDQLDDAVSTAVSLGARLADHQPQQHVRVMIDPAGHPFCLCLDRDE
jgi:catechol 2,3-dioxygenase-like lactoylglutathione lyase family enzyme